LNKPHLLAGRSFTMLGVVVVLVELTRYWFDNHTPNWVVLLVAGVFLFIGGYLLDAPGAKDMAGVVVNGVVAVVGVVRSGRRSTDTAVVQPAVTVPAASGEHVEPAVVTGASGDTMIIVPGVSTAPSKTDSEDA
jgi:hypothetical protein